MLGMSKHGDKEMDGFTIKVFDLHVRPKPAIVP